MSVELWVPARRNRHEHNDLTGYIRITITRNLWQNYGLVFPGQGSQKIGMLSSLAESYPLLLDTFREASDVLGKDMWEVCQQDSDNSLDQTHVTQPAILTASVATWRVWKNQGAPDPLIMAGHSLGEYSALVCSGVIPFAGAVKLVEKRGRYMQQAVPAGQGAMAAIVGLEDYQIHEICLTSRTRGGSFCGQF